MLDEQIIKALELCFADDFEKCEECPLKDKRDIIFSCMRTKQELTRDLIKRQKAEIAELKSDLILKTNDYELLKTAYEKAENVSVGRKDRLMKAVAELQKAQAEIERLNAKIKSLYREIERIALMTTETDEKPVKLEHNSLCETETFMGE